MRHAVGRVRASYRRYRASHRKSKGVPLGVKLGAGVMVVPPLIFPSVSAIQGLVGDLPGQPSGVQADMMGKAMWSAATFIDELAAGYGFNRPFGQVKVPIAGSPGSSFTAPTGTNVPKNLFITTTAIGAGVTISSSIQTWIARKLAGVKQVRILNRRVA